MPALSSVAAIAAAGALSLPGGMRLGDHALAPVSCGVRETLWFDHYTAVLYAPSSEPAAAALLDPASAKVLEIQIVSSAFIPGEMPRKYRRALEERLDASAWNRVRAAYRLLQSGDSISIVYVPGEGVSLRHNGALVARAPDQTVIEAILAVWADGKPVPARLQATIARHPCPNKLAG
jgi:hypothetical protein